MMIHQTLEKLREMRLCGMAKSLVEQIERPDFAGLSFEERVGLLVDREWTYRQNRRLERLLSEEGLRLSSCMEDIDYRSPRGLDKSLMLSLESCGWVFARHNILITGPTGVGKSYIACALGNAALSHGFSTRYHRIPKLISELQLAKGDGSYPKILARLSKIQVLILDDWGVSPISQTEARYILEVVEDRYKARSTIVCSQIPIEDWHGVILDPTLADAILDRLVHNSHKIVMRGESMRKLENINSIDH